MDIRRLRYFVAVAEELHFSRAARRLYLDQGALSAAIRRLERDLDVRLFDRTSRRVELTVAGAGLLPEARALIEQADRLQATVRRFRDAASTRLTVGLFLGAQAAGELTGPIIQAFGGRYPDIAVTARALDVADPWGEDHPDLDIVISRGQGLPGDTVTPLFSEPHGVVLDRRDELAGEAEIRVADHLDRSWAVCADTVSPRARALRDAHTPDAGACALPQVPIGNEPIVRNWQEMARRRVLIMAPSSAMRSAHLPDVTWRPVTDRPASTVTVLQRRPDSRTAALRDVAVEVSRSLIGIVPDALRQC